MKVEGQVRIPSGCAIAAVISREGRKIPGDLISKAMVPMHDYLELDSDARINYPSTVGTNWRWRALPGSFTPELADRLRENMQLYRRLPE